MKSNFNKYDVVNTLPANAVSVADYCKEQDYTTSNFYNQYRKNRITKVKVVVFQGFNFVVKNTSKIS